MITSQEVEQTQESTTNPRKDVLFDVLPQNANRTLQLINIANTLP